MKIEELKQLSAYELIESKTLEDLNSEGIILKHRKTGAKVSLIVNDDDNKVFYIGFRTPPKNSTGVAHILEHSVLCGSKEFPIKDPFVELVKGSLNTFLNAMTYPDKTIYPVASCNQKDFQNLLHVYLDAVFFPNIYKNKRIFEQEGWHYEMESIEEELTINGVVYNEMKGAFSSSDDVLEREIMNSLYPNNTYGLESGGDPEVIPQLTYEEFLEFHKAYYHPSNAYIYLYGNVNMVEKLKFIDENYLSKFEGIHVDSDVNMQTEFVEMNRIIKEYPIGEGEDEEESGYLTYGMTVGNSIDSELSIAFQVIDYALCSAPGAPLKQALVEKGIGKDVFSIYENGIKQPFFCIVSKGVDMKKEVEFKTVVEEEIKKISIEGFNKKSLLAALSYFEFKYREADFGSYPKGLMYGLQALDSWLYDETKPFVHLEANKVFAKLKNLVHSDYFEKLLEKYCIQNPHKAMVILSPQKGLTAKKEEELKAKLAEIKKSLSKQELQQIVEDTASLLEFQESEDKKEDIEKLPLLTREDIDKEARKIKNIKKNIGDTVALHHDVFTNGIAYIRLIFSLENIPERLFPYIGILKGCLGVLNTKNHEYGDLFNEINIYTGGMAAVNNAYTLVDDLEGCKLTLELKTKVLYENIEKAIHLMEEIMMSSDFTDEKRLQEILSEGKTRMQSSMMSSSHSVAVSRAISYGSRNGVISETLSGIPFFRLVSQLETNFQLEKINLIENLKELSKMIFRKENLMVDYVGTEKGYEVLPKIIEALKERLYKEPIEIGSYLPTFTKKNEGFKTSSQVQYVCRAGNFRRKGLAYKGALKIVKVMLGYEYLWTNVRVKGGAYGCMCNFGKTGDCYFVSYRDPNLEKTIDVYEQAANAVMNFEGNDRTITQYIIGAISDLDTPMNPAALGLFSLSAYMTGITQEMLQKEREEIINTTQEDIRACGAHIKAFLEDEFLCVVGNGEKISEQANLFLNIENLI